MVQVLNTVELATDGELRTAPPVTISVNAAKLKVTGARVVYPDTQDLPLVTRDGRTHFTLSHLQRYAAIYLKLA